MTGIHKEGYHGDPFALLGDPHQYLLSEGQRKKGEARLEPLLCCSIAKSGVQSPNARYRKVTIWARLQTVLGPKLVALRPLVMPFSTAHSTAPS